MDGSTRLDRARSLLDDMSRAFIERLPDRFDAIESLVLGFGPEAATDDEVYAELLRLVHSLKGTAGSFGAAGVTAICHGFEDLLLRPGLAARPPGTLARDVLAFVDVLRLLVSRGGVRDSRVACVEAEWTALRTRSVDACRVVLVASSSRACAELCVVALESLGVHTVVEASGLAALTRLVHSHYDGLIATRELPELSGPSLIAAIRLAHGPNRDVPTVLISSSESDDLPRIASPDARVRRDESMLAAVVEHIRRLLGIGEGVRSQV